ncbi:hypothetical protein [Catenibacillus scindens]|uniref:hypothetical protein n=1 Tax=Catenibacillus scindens TaxID=673271 RepID=UPI003209C21D
MPSLFTATKKQQEPDKTSPVAEYKNRNSSATPTLRHADLRLMPLLCSLSGVSGGHFIRNGRLILMQA